MTLFDVERLNGVRTDGDGVLTLGPTVTIDLRLGEEGVSSLGFRVFAICQPAACDAALSMGVDPESQQVPEGGDASFEVTLTNSGGDDLQNVVVDSSVDACDSTIGVLAVGELRSYLCAVSGVSGDLSVSFAASGEGVSDPDTCVARPRPVPQ